jgi:hypothetical protein
MSYTNWLSFKKVVGKNVQKTPKIDILRRYKLELFSNSTNFVHR